ncbi:tRNA uridine-5-carboxymethylaminomethyl(34) synthesis GTPase MnmE [Moheibacter lacus]|uniref:tRNA modification GTPase MnmE n=1 Tax=Moheibacter lacus TaxID=2745851 RepID=A0A838ZT36_9FLAO|nr:tRNA uridine-5-carboxymethylaminomethyl(34) synthesis GTPase MnmE [Moheibacter lacus]MBA5630148.1 tRNA uridine-5-carboxymethylaminomethyl(34) synthesis GTPase MnmE [Moheibacter lacus]
MFQNDTICATATAQGVGALGIIRISGPDSISLVNQIFKGKDLTKVDSHTVQYGFIVDTKQETQKNVTNIDEVMVAIFKAPKTFTAEDLVEINCHGSPFIQQAIIDLLIQKGARLAEPGEFTQRAFLNGRIDLSQAEAVADLISAENKASHQVALNQMRGGISTELKDLREELINFTALIELELDFSEEDVEFANRSELEELIQNLKYKIRNLLATFEYGNAIKNGVPVAIIGKPNAGKSTLLNALLNEERAIVSDIAGTTRDTIEETITIDGITFRFIDTAGIRETEDVIEAIGVEKAKEKIRQAKIVLHLYEEDIDLLRELESELQDKIVFSLLSKIDKNDWATDRFEKYLQDHYPNMHHFGISVKTGFNFDKLKSELVNSIKSGVDENAVIITNLRHKEALQNAMESLESVESGMKMGLTGDLLAFHLRETLKHIGSITGQIDVDQDILGTIFGKFCIGK